MQVRCVRRSARGPVNGWYDSLLYNQRLMRWVIWDAIAGKMFESNCWEVIGKDWNAVWTCCQVGEN